jgi:hypothetical protein
MSSVKLRRGRGRPPQDLGSLLLSWRDDLKLMLEIDQLRHDLRRSGHLTPTKEAIYQVAKRRRGNRKLESVTNTLTRRRKRYLASRRLVSRYTEQMMRGEIPDPANPRWLAVAAHLFGEDGGV